MIIVRHPHRFDNWDQPVCTSADRLHPQSTLNECKGLNENIVARNERRRVAQQLSPGETRILVEPIISIEECV